MCGPAIIAVGLALMSFSSRHADRTMLFSGFAFVAAGALLTVIDLATGK